MLAKRLDAYKYIATKRRPLAERAQDIGAWFNILRAITYLSVVSNVRNILLHFTTLLSFIKIHSRL